MKIDKSLHKIFHLCILVLLFTSNINAQVLSGNIINKTAGNYVHFFYSVGLVQKHDSVAVQLNGRFSKRFKFNDGRYVTILYDKHTAYIFVFPEAKLEITFNASDERTFKNTFDVKGDYNISRYLTLITENNLHANFIENRVNIKEPIDSFSRVLRDFRFFSDSLRQAYFQPSTSNKKIKALDDFLITDSIQWYSYSLLLANDYVRVISLGNKQLFRKEEIEKRVLNTTSDTYLTSDWYKRLWLYFLKAEYEAEIKGSDSIEVAEQGFTTFAIRYINSKNLSGKLKEHIISQLLNDILISYTYGSFEEARRKDSLISHLKLAINDPVFLASFDKLYNSSKKVLLSQKIGTKAPAIQLVDPAGESHSLKEFRGKVLLIDVWASWCQPCISEFPHLRELTRKLNNRDFLLLSVSVDGSRETWIKNGVLKFNPPGIALWVGKEKQFTRDYNINLIPVLILLDKNGNFINFNPPRASEGDRLYKLILERLED